MADNIEKLVREYLERLDRKVDAVAADLGATRKMLSDVMQVLESQDAPLLRAEDRLGAIEERLQRHDPDQQEVLLSRTTVILTDDAWARLQAEPEAPPVPTPELVALMASTPPWA